MLVSLNRPWFLGLRPLHMRKLAPRCKVIIMCSLRQPLTPKRLKFHAVHLKGNWHVLEVYSGPKAFLDDFTGPKLLVTLVDLEIGFKILKLPH